MCDLVRVKTVPFGFGEEEDLEEEQDSQDADVEPEEAAPADVFGHWTGDDWTDLADVSDDDRFDNGTGYSHHERTKVECKVEGVVGTPLVQEYNVRDDLGLGCLIQGC